MASGINTLPAHGLLQILESWRLGTAASRWRRWRWWRWRRLWLRSRSCVVAFRTPVRILLSSAGRNWSDVSGGGGKRILHTVGWLPRWGRWRLVLGTIGSTVDPCSSVLRGRAHPWYRSVSPSIPRTDARIHQGRETVRATHELDDTRAAYALVTHLVHGDWRPHRAEEGRISVWQG